MRRFRLLLLIILVSGCDRPANPVWTWNLGGRCYAHPLLEGGELFVVSHNGVVTAGDPQTGQRAWTVQTGETLVAAPVIQGNSLLIGSLQGKILALDVKSGQLLWSSAFHPGGFEAPFAADEGLLVAPTNLGSLLGLSPTDGNVLWKISGQTKFSSRPLLNGSLIFIGGWGNEFLCLRRNGTVEWRVRTPERIVEEALFLRNVLFVPLRDRFVYALDAPTGRVIWRREAMQPTGVTSFRDGIVFASGNDIVMLQPDSGNELRRVQTGVHIDRIFTYRDLVIVVSRGSTYAVDPIRKTIRRFLPDRFRLFRLAFGPRIMIASDETSSILGFTPLFE